MNNDENNVWVNREEYERLKAVASQQSVAPASPGGIETSPYPSISPGATIEKNSSSNAMLLITGALALFSFIYPPLLILFLIFGIITVAKFAKTTSGGGSSKKKKVGIILLVGVPFLFVAGPTLLMFAFIIFWQLGCWTGLGSCTSV